MAFVMSCKKFLWGWCENTDHEYLLVTKLICKILIHKTNLPNIFTQLFQEINMERFPELR